jgi:hypothetical protein
VGIGGVYNPASGYALDVIGNANITGTTTTDTIIGSNDGTAVSLYNEATRTGAINIGTGATGVKTVTVGGTNTTLTLSASSLNCNITNGGTVTLGTLMTSGSITIGGSAATTLSIGTGNSQTGPIGIGSGTGAKTITIGNTTGSNILNLTSNTVNLQTVSGSILIGTTATAGVINIGGSSTNSLTIQRPIQLSSGADPTGAVSAIGYIAPLITGTSGAISVPTNTYTWSTGARSLGIGVWMLSLEAQYSVPTVLTAFIFNMGFMSSAPVTGDSATASRAPTNTIANINGNLRSDFKSALTDGTYVNQIGGVVVNNYGGTFNNVYGIFNADWTTSGTVTMTSLTIRATKIG